MKKFFTKISVVLSLLLILSFSNGIVAYASTGNSNNNIITPQVTLHIQTFTTTGTRSKQIGIYCVGIKIGYVNLTANYTETETWYVDQYGNKYSLISDKVNINSGDYSIACPGDVTVLSSGVASDKQSYTVKIRVYYSYKAVMYTIIANYTIYSSDI